jgi:hypothetical protein
MGAVAQLGFSRDGKKVVWSAQVARDSSTTEIFVAAMDGNSITTNSIIRLTTNDQYDAFPVLSPDGAQVAFERSLNRTNRYGHPSRIMIVSSDGRGPERPLALREDFFEARPTSWAAWGNASTSTAVTARPQRTNKAAPAKPSAAANKTPAR